MSLPLQNITQSIYAFKALTGHHLIQNTQNCTSFLFLSYFILCINVLPRFCFS